MVKVNFGWVAGLVGRGFGCDCGFGCCLIELVDCWDDELGDS